MPDSGPDPSALLARLQRATEALTAGEPAAAALTPGERPLPAPVPATKRSGALLQRAISFGGLAFSVVLGVVSNGQLAMFVPALAIGAVSVVSLWSSLGSRGLDPTRARVGMGASERAGLVDLSGDRDPTRAHVGMGASVGEGARLEPGAVVGMGATVGRDVHLEPGAVVGMGATVGDGAVLRRDARVSAGSTISDGAVLEAGAVVASGSSVGREAVVGEGARIGLGATVGRNAYVPPGMVVRAGSTWNNTDRSSALAPAPRPALPASVQDPRAARIDTASAKLEAEIQRAPPQAREYLGASVGTVRALRDTCHGLLRRELALRAETSAESVAELEEGRRSLRQRLDAATDEHVRRSLASALAAVDEQQRQRALMARTADRLDAELTRLLWTMDGMGAQLVRLRTAGAEVGAAADVETSRGVKKLQDEIGAIADALEEIAAAQRAEIIPVSDVGGDGPAGVPERQRERG